MFRHPALSKEETEQGEREEGAGGRDGGKGEEGGEVAFCCFHGSRPFHSLIVPRTLVSLSGHGLFSLTS